MFAFCFIRCREGTLSMEWPILHGSRCLIGSIHWDFSGKHPFHFSNFFNFLFFFLPSSLCSFCPGSLESNVFEGLDFPRMLGNIMS